MFDGPFERFDSQRRWLGFFTRVWRKEAGSARGAVFCETGAYPDADGAVRAAENLVAHFAAQVRAKSAAGGESHSAVLASSPPTMGPVPSSANASGHSGATTGQVVAGEIVR